jgi:hypothetical protein
MIRIDRRLVAWVVSLGLACLGVVIAVRAFWPGMLSQGPGVGAVSLGLFPSLGTLLFLLGNVALSMIARRRGGRAASIGASCLWTIGILVLVSFAVSLTPPFVFQAANARVDLVLFLLLGIAVSPPTQLLILAFLAFAVISSSRTDTAGHTI